MTPQSRIRPSARIVAVPLVLVSAGVAGAAWAGIADLLRRRYHVLEVISTLLLNFVAAYGVSYLVRGPLQEHTRVYPQTETIALAALIQATLAIR